MNATRLRAGLVACALGLAACATQSPETELRPEAMDGMFFTRFADAQSAAAQSQKLILVEMWRPG